MRVGSSPACVSRGPCERSRDHPPRWAGAPARPRTAGRRPARRRDRWVVPLAPALPPKLFYDADGSELFEATYLPSGNFANYAAVFVEQPFGRNILNSIAVAFAVVSLSLALGVVAAFPLARIPFRGRGLLLAAVLSASMFPQVAVLAGLFQIFRELGLSNSLWSLVFSYMIFTLPFTVWVLTTFMRDLPVEIEEAAIVDGASPWVIITRVFMPLMWPALVTTGLLAFIGAWNEFLFALFQFGDINAKSDQPSFAGPGLDHAQPPAIVQMLLQRCSGISMALHPKGNPVFQNLTRHLVLAAFCASADDVLKFPADLDEIRARAVKILVFAIAHDETVICIVENKTVRQ